MFLEIWSEHALYKSTLTLTVDTVQVMFIAANPPGFSGNLPDFETCPGIVDLKKNPGF